MVQGREPEAAPPPPMKDLTDNPSAGVTLPQLRGYYLRAGVARGRPNGSGRTSATDLYDNELFNCSTRSRMIALTKDQLKNVAKLMSKLDTDGDELITLQEILPNLGYQTFMAPSALNRAVLVAGPVRQGRAIIAERIIAKYDTKKAKKLSRTELAIPADMFAALRREQGRAFGHARARALAGPAAGPRSSWSASTRPRRGRVPAARAVGKPRAMATATHFSRIGRRW